MTPVLIAHRGEPVSFPENSIAGYEAVLQAGANWIETDVQITADGVPVLCHDPSLLKLTGHDLNINTTVYADMQDLPAGYPDRFGDRFSQLRISRLDEFARLLSQWPQARAFVELKQPSLMEPGPLSSSSSPASWTMTSSMSSISCWRRLLPACHRAS
jgi:glycerophosphoryl diester phosphodiesterase